MLPDRPSGSWFSRRSAAFVLVVCTLSVVSCPAAHAGGDFGSYLIGRTALLRDDFTTAARSFSVAIAESENYPGVIEEAVLAQLAAGNVREAVRFAESLVAEEYESHVARLVLYADAMRLGEYATALEVLEGDASPTADLLRPWADLGIGELEGGWTRLITPYVHQDESQPNEAIIRLREYNQGLFALAAGMEAEGLEILEGIADVPFLMTPVAVAYATRFDETGARAMYLDAIRRDPNSGRLREAFLGGDVIHIFSSGSSAPVDGVVESLLANGRLGMSQRRGFYSLLLFRLAEYLRPDNLNVRLALGDSFGGRNLSDWAMEASQAQGVEGVELRISAARALLEVGQNSDAYENLEQLVVQFPDSPVVHYARGTVHRWSESYEVAREAYTQVLDQIGHAQTELNRIETLYSWQDVSEMERLMALNMLPSDERESYLVALADVAAFEPRMGRLYFERGMSSERLGDWALAEADLKRSLELDPDNPNIANYLAYSWVDMGINLETGLEMLEAASAARPENGNIIDSVGWARFRLGDYEGALRDLEYAVELEPGAPEIYDHIGDVLWRLGLHKEARFQWERVLTLDPDNSLREAVEIKLQVGLP